MKFYAYKISSSILDTDFHEENIFMKTDKWRGPFTSSILKEKNSAPLTVKNTPFCGSGKSVPFSNILAHKNSFYV